jgi:hypothetical protein
VRDQEDGEAFAALQVGKQRQHLRLDRDVERGRRLVGDQHLGRTGEGDRDHDALAHAAENWCA